VLVTSGSLATFALVWLLLGVATGEELATRENAIVSGTLLFLAVHSAFLFWPADPALIGPTAGGFELTFPFVRRLLSFSSFIPLLLMAGLVPVPAGARAWALLAALMLGAIWSFVAFRMTRRRIRVTDGGLKVVTLRGRPIRSIGWPEVRSWRQTADGSVVVESTQGSLSVGPEWNGTAVLRDELEKRLPPKP
jgi:hypothetical protein